jgi:hypothetical protein
MNLSQSTSPGHKGLGDVRDFDVDRVLADAMRAIEGLDLGAPEQSAPQWPVLPDNLAGLARVGEVMADLLKRRTQLRDDYVLRQQEVGLEPREFVATYDRHTSILERWTQTIFVRYRELREQYVGQLLAFRFERGTDADFQAAVQEIPGYSDEVLETLHQELLHVGYDQPVTKRAGDA